MMQCSDSKSPRRVIGGVEVTQEEVVHKLLPLVKYIARRHLARASWGVEMSDLIQEGVLGLIDALSKFDDSRGVKFETYATVRINGTIMDKLRSADSVPRTVRRQQHRLADAQASLESKLARTPSWSEVADELGVGLYDLHDMRAKSQTSVVISLDEALFDRGSGRQPALIERLADANANDMCSDLMDRDLRRELVRAVKSLPRKERVVVESYYFKGIAMKNVARILGVSGSRTSQIHVKAIKRLRQTLYESALVAQERKTAEAA